jgi:AraC-like DNA-binding protein
LLETDWSITNIAQQVGYANLSSFTRLFIKAEGHSPQAYRKGVESVKDAVH